MRFMSFVQQTISANPTKQSQNAKSSFVLLLYHCMYTSQFKQKLSSQIFTCECSAIVMAAVLPVLPSFWGVKPNLIRPLFRNAPFGAHLALPTNQELVIENLGCSNQQNGRIKKDDCWIHVSFCTVFMIYIYMYITFLCVCVCLIMSVNIFFNMYDSPPWKKWGCSRLFSTSSSICHWLLILKKDHPSSRWSRPCTPFSAEVFLQKKTAAEHDDRPAASH